MTIFFIKYFLSCVSTNNECIANHDWIYKYIYQHNKCCFILVWKKTYYTCQINVLLIQNHSYKYFWYFKHSIKINFILLTPLQKRKSNIRSSPCLIKKDIDLARQFWGFLEASFVLIYYHLLFFFYLLFVFK